jgi:hypothetical protein
LQGAAAATADATPFHQARRYTTLPSSPRSHFIKLTAPTTYEDESQEEGQAKGVPSWAIST